MTRLYTKFPALSLCLSLTMSLAACSDDANPDGAEVFGDGGEGDGDSSGECADPDDPDAIVTVASDITEDTTWSCDKVYLLTPESQIVVDGAILTIEPGTTIKGTAGSALIIEKNARIEAEGSAEAPIVFTSNEPSPAPGDWGGLVLLGEASANCGESCQAEGFAIPPLYAGSDDAHDCGTLAYARVEYAGFAISEGNELNGITFYACGSQTTVHHVQSHMGLDDGIEMFGGTFDLDHIIVTGANDDSLDIDQGFRGTVQHLLIQQNPAVGDNCFEVSNQGSNFAATPLTTPVVCNATCLGSGLTGEKSKGITVKEGTQGEWYASIIANVTNEAALLADEPSFEIVDAGGVVIENNIFAGNGSPEFVSGATSLDSEGWQAWVWDPARENLADAPEFANTTWGSADLTPGADVTSSGTVGAGCEATSHIGAVDPAGDDWTQADWINYRP